jgi:hypothetical protein
MWALLIYPDLSGEIPSVRRAHPDDDVVPGPRCQGGWSGGSQLRSFDVDDQFQPVTEEFGSDDPAGHFVVVRKTASGDGCSVYLDVLRPDANISALCRGRRFLALARAPEGADVRFDEQSAGDAGRLADRDQIRTADEVRDECRLRLLVQAFRTVDLLNPPLVHDDDDVGQRQSFGLIVRHVKRRSRRLFLEGTKLQAQLGAQLGIKVRQRLVEQEHLGFGEQCPRQGEPLLLAAAELG